MPIATLLRSFQVLGALALTTILGGCLFGEPTINASTEESLRSSVASIFQSLGPDEATAFEAALRVVVMSDVADVYDGSGIFGAIASARQLVPKEMLATVKESLHGRTAQEAIKIAEDLAEARKAHRIATLDLQIAAIDAAIEEYKIGLTEKQRVLDQVIIANPVYRWHNNSLYREPVLEFNIQNGSDRAIAVISPQGLLRSKGRSIPWVDTTFNYKLKGGIEPGESQHLALAPGMFSEWGEQNLDGRDDLELLITLVDMADADEKMLIGWSPDYELQVQQLTNLKAEREALASE